MKAFELERLREASGLFNRMLAQIDQYLVRTYPRVTRPGSQGDEDRILAELLPGEGVYVDIGAAEPVQCSNTWALYQRGWRGLLVEPCMGFWPALVHQRPGDFLYDSAVRRYTGQTFLRVQGTVSSVLPIWKINEANLLLVPCETTRDLLSHYPNISQACRFCSMDVEGAEREVIETIDWKTFHPEVFCVEYRVYDPEKLGHDLSANWIGLLGDRGYREVARTDWNIIFQAAAAGS